MQLFRFFSSTVLLLLIVFSCPCFSAEYRTWTGNTDDFPVEAVYRGYSSRTANGVTTRTIFLQTKAGDESLSVAFEDFSEADQKYLEELLEQARIAREKRRSTSGVEAEVDAEKRALEREQIALEREKVAAEREKLRAEKQAAAEAKKKAEREKLAAERAAANAKAKAAAEKRESERKVREAQYAAERAARDAAQEKARIERETKARIEKVRKMTEHRTWTDNRSKFKVEAQLLDCNDGNVLLERKDNKKQVSMPLDKLSSPDRDYVKVAMVEFTKEAPDFVRYASPDNSFVRRIPVTQLSKVPLTPTDDIPTTWSVVPDPAKTKKMDFIPTDVYVGMDKQAGSPSRAVHFCDDALEKILAGTTSPSSHNNTATSQFVFKDLKTGVGFSQTYPVRTETFGLSPDGTRALVGHAAGAKDTLITFLAVIDTTKHSLPCIEAFQLWNQEKVASIRGAHWIDKEHILVEAGYLVLLRITDGTVMWKMSGYEAKLSPGKKYFAAINKGRVFLAESLTGKLVGGITLPLGNGSLKQLVFSPDGKKLAKPVSVFGGWMIQVQDMETGVAGEPFYVPGTHFAHTCFWVDNTHLLATGVCSGSRGSTEGGPTLSVALPGYKDIVAVLVDVDAQLPVWAYSYPSTGYLRDECFFAGRLWHCDVVANEWFRLNSMEFPPRALPRLPPLTDEQKYFVQPGHAVKLVVDEAVPDGDKLRDYFTTMLTDNGQKIAFDAPLVLNVRIVTGMPVEISYLSELDYRRKQSAERYTGRMGAVSPKLKEYFEKEAKVLAKAFFTPRTYIVEYVKDGQTLWNVNAAMYKPIISYDDFPKITLVDRMKVLGIDDETIQDVIAKIFQSGLPPDLTTNLLNVPDVSNETTQKILTEKSKPTSEWFFCVKIPPQIPYDKMGRSQLHP